MAKRPTKKPGPPKKAAGKKPPVKKPASKKPTAKQPPAKKTAPGGKKPAGTLEWVESLPVLKALVPHLAGLKLRLATDVESRKGGAALEDHYAEDWHLGVLWSDVLWKACQERVQGLRLLAHAPAFPREGGGTSDGGLYFHPERPGELWFAPGSDFPAVLFIPVKAEPEALRALMAEFDPDRPRPTRFERTRRERAFMGYQHNQKVPNPYSGQLEEAGPHELDRHFNFSPAAKGLVWGTTYLDDPVPGDPLAKGGGATWLAMVQVSRDVRQQLPGATATLTRATIFSHSHLGVEMHRGGVYVWTLAFRPSAVSAPAIAHFNQVTGYRLPPDLPVDLAAAIHGFEWIETSWLQDRIREPGKPEDRAELLRVLLAVQHEDLGAVLATLRAHAASPELPVRGTLANASLDYNWEFFLEELALKEKEPGLRKFAEDLLQSGLPPPEFNDMGELLGDGELDALEEEEEEP